MNLLAACWANVDLWPYTLVVVAQACGFRLRIVDITFPAVIDVTGL